MADPERHEPVDVDLPPPVEVRLAADRASLTLVWPDGGLDTLNAPRLRAACRCADCTRQRHDGTFPTIFAPLTIAGLATMGTHAINIRFSDGHARGIFPWSYLKRLSRPV